MFRYTLDSADPVKLAPVIHALRSGAVAVIPTDTIYGLSARIDRPSALRRIAAIKGRDASLPFLVLVPGIEPLPSLTATPLPAAVVDLLWPGPVTVLLEAGPGLPPQLVGERGTVAVRWPDTALLCQILAGVGAPLVSTSINRSGEEPLTEPAKIARQFGEAIDVLLDHGPAQDPRPSTVLDLTVRPPRVVRQGKGTVDLERLGRCLAL